jgi:hypothetical protein
LLDRLFHRLGRGGHGGRYGNDRFDSRHYGGGGESRHGLVGGHFRGGGGHGPHNHRDARPVDPRQRYPRDDPYSYYGMNLGAEIDKDRMGIRIMEAVVGTVCIPRRLACRLVSDVEFAPTTFYDTFMSGHFLPPRNLTSF